MPEKQVLDVIQETYTITIFMTFFMLLLFFQHIAYNIINVQKIKLNSLKSDLLLFECGN